MTRIILASVCCVILSIPFSRLESKPMKRLTPVLVVESIEQCLPFWVDRLGFEASLHVPEGDRLGFVLLSSNGVEVMLQTRASVAKDVPALADDTFHSALFVEVEELDPIRKAVAGMELVFDVRKTFYGSTEICVREPGGNIVTFAEFTSE